jgi:hypothetical protein
VHSSPSRRWARRAAPAAVALTAAVLAAPAAAAAPSVEVVADGLANPRGLAFGPGGLYVAESGSGGAGPCITGPEGGESCYGPTGAITRIDVRSGAKEQVVSGLPSHAPQTGPNPGGDATGPNDVSFDGHAGYFTVGLGADPAVRDQLGRAGPDFGALYRFDRDGVSTVADIAAYEAANNPDQDQPEAAVDSNPYSVDAHGRQMLVTDAGGNTLLGVSRKGDIETLGVFPFGETTAPEGIPGLPAGTPIPYQPVPTGVARGPDGAPYVGQLTGFPFPAGAANVYRVTDGTPTAVLEGFTTIVDIAFGHDALYVLQISTDGLLVTAPPTGRLIRVDRDGTRTELAAGELTAPTGVAVSDHGDVYVANMGPTTDGQIVRIRDHHGDGDGGHHG